MKAGRNLCPICRTKVDKNLVVDLKKTEDGDIRADLPDEQSESNDSGFKLDGPDSAKIEALMQIIDTTLSMLRRDRKFVIFSQFPSIFER